MKFKLSKSIRVRLTTWFAVAFLSATVLIFSAFYFTTRQALYNNTDSNLTAYGNKIMSTLISDSLDISKQINDQELIMEFGEMPGTVALVINGSGQIVSGSLVNPKNLDVYTKLYQQSSTAVKPYFQNERVGNMDMRFLILPVRQGSEYRGAVIVGHSIDVIEASLDALLWELVIVLLIFAIPGTFGGYAIARSAMKPITDISKKLGKIGHKNLEDRVPNPKTGDELEELAQTFNKLLDRINDAFKREKQFIGDVAHELKTPLAILKSRIEVSLSKDRTKETYQKELVEILADVDKLTFTLRDILDLAWSESDKSKMEMEKIPFSALTEELKEIALNLASAKSISVTSRINEKIFIYGKKDKLSRALLNLVDNAIKYTNPKGNIEITLLKSKKNAVWQIKDSGMGISKQDLPHIFERFYRGSKSRQLQGSGLGLAIAKAIFKAHNGKIEVISQLNKGTTVKVALPLA